MTTHLVTFSDESMSRAVDLCVTSAATHGITEQVWHWTDRGLRETEFYEHNKALLVSVRGLGYWAWKPYIISDTMDRVRGGDYLIYSDAGIEFINNVRYVIDRMDQDIFLFGNNWDHAHWCKRDIVDEVWELLALDQPYYDYSYRFGGEPKRDENDYISWENFGKQCQASVIFFRVSDYTRRFVAEWLYWCLFEGGRLIDDSPSRAPNHLEFQENRHDQAILTTLAYREGIRLHYWPASYNNGAFNYKKLPCYAGDDYPILFNHHRRRNADWGTNAHNSQRTHPAPLATLRL